MKIKAHVTFGLLWVCLNRCMSEATLKPFLDPITQFFDMLQNAASVYCDNQTEYVFIFRSFLGSFIYSFTLYSFLPSFIHLLARSFMKRLCHHLCRIYSFVCVRLFIQKNKKVETFYPVLTINHKCDVIIC